MKIKKITIKNFRLFNAENPFSVDNLNIPNNADEGSGITVFVGENGCGKTTLLEAIALPLLSYKADSFQLNDLNNPDERTMIELFSESNFNVNGTMPNSTFLAKGFLFEAGVRARENRAYLSTIVVSDQKFIKADNQNRPIANSPDLRVSVNNPFSGQRFNENDVIYLDRNRTFQTRSGTYNPTRFDRLMEDFDYKYIKGEDSINDLNTNLEEVTQRNVANEFLNSAVNKFGEMTGISISLNFLDNWRPFNRAFFAEKKENNQLINLNMFGSGYEMIFSLIYSYYLSTQSGKQLILLIDEPELHLHPSLQFEFVKFLLAISKDVQIILTSQSPLFVKQLLANSKVKTLIVKLNADDEPELVSMNKKVLPYLSANEVNFLAFGLPTVEYHNELYGSIQEIKPAYRISEMETYLVQRGTAQNKSWIKLTNGNPDSPVQYTLPTYIRNSIHHPENNHNPQFTPEELKQSIEQLYNLWPIT
ncbi:MAG TPA: AAA family ATPase [Candidatus Woesebacteria bacterium]|nr:AAA family ATPase [Candidatus Woesebacteria bacterium]